ncbi:MAG: group 1 glycosyl transferase, partial [Chitinophagaceae bacterium]
MRILVLNNYSFTRVLNEVECKLKPAHHLYGLNIIKERGHELIILEKNTSSFIYKLFNFLAKIPLCNFGDVELQIRAILKSNQYDLIYAPCQDCTPLLGILSYFKFFNKPIIAIAHHPFLVGRLTFFKKIGLYFSLNGHFAYPALSAVIANQINSVVKKDLSFELFWGPDIQYYNSLVEKKPTVENKFDIVSIGRTGRDYN